MLPISHDIQPGLKVSHVELGDGVVVGCEPTGYITVFFRNSGEQQVPADSLRPVADRFDQIVQSMAPASIERLERLWQAVEAEEIPLMESAAILTSAKVDLLPHQVVLVHRVTNARPKRFLIADEVGLGKTIEAALILRELASRGELQRAIMIVPAGLVENWRRELNDVFNLDFEVFGIEGDVSVEIPAQTGHRFRFKSATHSGANRPPVPIQIGRAFRFKSATPLKGEVTLDN